MELRIMSSELSFHVNSSNILVILVIIQCVMCTHSHCNAWRSSRVVRYLFRVLPGFTASERRHLVTTLNGNLPKQLLEGEEGFLLAW